MKIKSVADVWSDIMDILADEIKNLMGLPKVISDVDLVSISQVFVDMQKDGADVRLYLPGEISPEMVVRYKPCTDLNFFIFIKSVEVKKLSPKINTINYN